MATSQALLSQLLAAPTQTQVYQAILSYLQVGGFPTSEWEDGGPEKTLIQAFASAMFNYAAKMTPIVAAGGLVDLSTLGWLTLLARELYNLERNLATHTLGILALKCLANNGPYTLAAEQLWVVGAGGNRYKNVLGGILRAPGFSSVTHSGPGSGTVATSGSAGNTTGLNIVVLITTSGALGAGVFRWSADGGETFGPPTTLPGGGSHTDLASSITIIFTGTFTLGDTYSFSSYGTLRLLFQSEFPNNSKANPQLNYIDASNTLIDLVTPLPGVSINNPAADYSAVSQTGVGPGVLNLTGIAIGAHSFAIRIDSPGQSGSAAWSYSIDAGAFVSVGVVTSALVGFGVTVELFDAVGAVQSFNAGDTYSFVTPGSWITSQGVDEEADPSLQTRCKNRWPSLASIPGSPTLGFYDLLVREASGQVTQSKVVTDGTINNLVKIYIAGQGNVLPAGTVAAVQAYLDSKNMLTDRPVVLSPTPVSVVIGGMTITVKSTSLATVQAAVQSALGAYFSSLDINPVIRMAEIIDIIMNVVGVLDVSEMTLTLNVNGTGATAGNAILPLPPGSDFQLAQWTQLVASAFSWVTT